MSSLFFFPSSSCVLVFLSPITTVSLKVDDRQTEPQVGSPLPLPFGAILKLADATWRVSQFCIRLAFRYYFLFDYVGDFSSALTEHREGREEEGEVEEGQDRFVVRVD